MQDKTHLQRSRSFSGGGWIQGWFWGVADGFGGSYLELSLIGMKRCEKEDDVEQEWINSVNGRKGKKEQCPQDRQTYCL
jgi:hypothetical protein